VDRQYADGRCTVLTDEELHREVAGTAKKLGIKLK
jgi:hypothetical protein